MASFKDMTIGQVAMRVLGFLAVFLGGAMLTVLMNSGAERVRTEQNTTRIASLEAQVQLLQRDYATNKRVDDIQLEMRSNYRDLSAKIDNVIKILLERPR